MNYPSGNVQNYPGLQQNVMPGAPVYLPPGSINYPPGNYPQYPGNAAYPSQGSGYGFVKTRNKRQTSQTKASNKSSKKYKNKNKTGKDDSSDKAHWGVHRLLSTGIFIVVVKFPFGKLLKSYSLRYNFIAVFYFILFVV